MLRKAPVVGAFLYMRSLIARQYASDIGYFPSVNTSLFYDIGYFPSVNTPLFYDIGYFPSVNTPLFLSHRLFPFGQYAAVLLFKNYNLKTGTDQVKTSECFNIAAVLSRSVCQECHNGKEN